VIEAIMAAVGFGFFLSALNLAMDQAGASTFTVAAASRTGSAALLTIIAIATSVKVAWPGKETPTIFAVGMVDFMANSMLAWASTRGSFAVVAVLGSLYPLVPMVLARVLLKERLGAIQRAGTIVIVVGVALIALAGSG
jgi:drug/metabolite transporter (DMT)-like permease